MGIHFPKLSDEFFTGMWTPLLLQLSMSEMVYLYGIGCVIFTTGATRSLVTSPMYCDGQSPDWPILASSFTSNALHRCVVQL